MLHFPNSLHTPRKGLSPLMLFFWVLLLWGGTYALRGYWEPDEARFVYVAREMLSSGDWLVPHRHGLTYAHKPPLMFWLINLGETILPKPFGSRLPSLLGVLLSLWAVSGIASLWRGRLTAIRSVFVLSSAWMFWDTCGMGQIDSLLLGLEMSALYLLIQNDRSRPIRTPWLAFILLGLAVMAKGPVGLLVPLGIYTMIRIYDKEEAHLGVGRLCLGLLTAIAIPVLWILACWLGGAPSEYLHELIFTQNVARAAGELGHRQPVYYFLLYAPVGFMPWTLFLPTAVARLRKNDPTLLRRIAGWVLFVVVFFSIPASKRNIYIMASLPGMALAIAAAWDEIEANKTCRTLAVAVLSLATVFLAMLSCVLLMGALPPVFKAREDTTFYIRSLQAWPFLLTLAVATSGLCHTLVFRRKWLIHYAISLCLLLSAAGLFILPTFNTIKVPNEITHLAQRYVPADGRLLLYGIYGETLALHAGVMGMRCDGDEAMTAAMAEQQRGLAVFLSRNTEDLRTRFPCITRTGDFRMGSKQFVWCAFDTAE